MKHKKTEWIIVKNHEKDEEFQIEVPFKWLINLFKKHFAQENVNMEQYVNGQMSHVYQLLSHDHEFANNLYEMAKSQNAILRKQYLHSY